MKKPLQTNIAMNDL